jgi:homoprotocatechuate degradation regulator HpaR
MGYFRPNLRRLGLTEQQWRVLRVLNDNGPTDAKQLATDAVLLPPSLSRIVRDLVRKGLLERRVASDDRRRVEIMITPAGIVALRSGARASVRAYDVIAHRFGSRDLATLLLLLERLEAALAPPRPGTPREK